LEDIVWRRLILRVECFLRGQNLGSLRIILCSISLTVITAHGIAGLVISTKDATFGFPDKRAVGGAVEEAMKARVSEQTLKRLMLVGDTIDGLEAQRLGLVDFVGDDLTCENEVARVVYRYCAPKKRTSLTRGDMVAAMEKQEALEDKANTSSTP